MTNSSYISFSHRKLALIIGNDNYSRPENRLSQSMKNVNGLSDLLKTINFQVKISVNSNKHQMETDIHDFSEMINNGDLILFYFSGHGYQVNGKNYLIPVDDNRIKTNRDVEDFAISVESLLTHLIKRNPSYATILILDCCRLYLLRNTAGSYGK